MRRSALLAFALLIAWPAAAEELPSRPDDAKTPGIVATTDIADVCGRVDGRTYSQRHRDTTAEMKRDAYAAYGVDKAGREFEVDHRVPLCLGGADALENLWPQKGWEHPSFHDKDRLETSACRAVCVTHEMTLEEGQALFLGDWITAFEEIFGQPPE